MEINLLDDFKLSLWKIAKWLGGAPGDVPEEDPRYADWIKPKEKPVQIERRLSCEKCPGDHEKRLKPIDEFYHRGAYSRHDISARHTPKAVMSFRGKGSKVERRSKRRDS